MVFVSHVQTLDIVTRLSSNLLFSCCCCQALVSTAYCLQLPSSESDLLSPEKITLTPLLLAVEVPAQSVTFNSCYNRQAAPIGPCYLPLESLSNDLPNPEKIEANRHHTRRILSLTSSLVHPATRDPLLTKPVM